MKPIRWILLVAFLGLVFSQMGSALEYKDYCVVFEDKSTPWTQTASVPKFDQNLGDLARVIVAAEASACQSFAIDAEDSWSGYTIVHLDTTVSVGEQFALVPLEIWRDEFGSYIDFVCGNDRDEFIYDDPADLAAWVGPGNVDFITTAVDDTTIDASGPFDVRIRTNASEMICVVYEYIPALCINGSKINDCTGEGIPGWEICLIKPDGEIVCTTTDENGDYSFCGLEPGEYEVCEETRNSWVPIDPICIDVTLVEESAEGVDFHNEPLLCIEGRKISGCNGEGLAGWTIDLLDYAGGVIRTAETNETGYYEFSGLAPGDYRVCEVLKDGWMSVGEECIDVPQQCENLHGVDFTNLPLFCISGHKYNSKTGEGLSGWTINLLKDGAVIRTTTTSTGGYYEFCGQAPGDYEVCEVMKSGWIPKSPSCILVNLECENSEDNDFKNEPVSTCGSGCRWFIKNELYTASCKMVKVVDAGRGILANDPAGSIVIDPESITIDPRYGSVEVHEDGSFVYDPTEATGLHSGAYVVFKYKASNGRCDARYLGIAKIQVRC